MGTSAVSHSNRLVTVAAAVAWAAACAGGLTALALYQATPGETAPAAGWPVGSRVPRARTVDTLVLVVHPKCPCSRATIDNLAMVMAHCPAGRVRAVALFVRPAGMPVGWERTDLWASAEAIPGVTVAADAGGIEAGRFGAVTSGQALLFDPAGRLLFRGGLTPGRGHAGDCGGTDAVLAVVRGDRSAAGPTPVFGCPLAGPTAGRRPCVRSREGA